MNLYDPFKTSLDVAQPIFLDTMIEYVDKVLILFAVAGKSILEIVV